MTKQDAEHLAAAFMVAAVVLQKLAETADATLAGTREAGALMRLGWALDNVHADVERLARRDGHTTYLPLSEAQALEATTRASA